MASRCTRILQRSSVSALKSAISKPVSSSTNRSAAAPFKMPSLSSNSVASPVRRFSLSRAPAELGGVASLLPLHSAVATARMTSCLSTSSRSCRALSQGTLCCTSPDLYPRQGYAFALSGKTPGHMSFQMLERNTRNLQGLPL